MLAANQRVAGVFDSAKMPRVDHVRIAIGPRRGLLHHRERANIVGIVTEQTRRKAQILDRAHRLNSIERIRRHRALAQKIFLDAQRGSCAPRPARPSVHSGPSATTCYSALSAWCRRRAMQRGAWFVLEQA